MSKCEDYETGCEDCGEIIECTHKHPLTINQQPPETTDDQIVLHTIRGASFDGEDWVHADEYMRLQHYAASIEKEIADWLDAREELAILVRDYGLEQASAAIRNGEWRA